MMENEKMIKQLAKGYLHILTEINTMVKYS